MNLFQLAFDHLQENGMSEEESDAMLLWWGSIGLGRLWSWEDEVQSLTGYQSDTLDTAAVAWINRGKPLTWGSYVSSPCCAAAVAWINRGKPKVKPE